MKVLMETFKHTASMVFEQGGYAWFFSGRSIKKKKEEERPQPVFSLWLTWAQWALN